MEHGLAGRFWEPCSFPGMVIGAAESRCQIGLKFEEINKINFKYLPGSDNRRMLPVRAKIRQATKSAECRRTEMFFV
jgi:hypothetical protein